MNTDSKENENLVDVHNPKYIKEVLTQYNVPDRFVQQLFDAMIFNGDPMQNYDAQDAASLLGVAKDTLAKWRSQGVGPNFEKFSGKIYYSREELARYKNSKKLSSIAESYSA